jgi:hypothetical protein
MKTTPFTILAFILSFNLSLFAMQAWSILPNTLAPQDSATNLANGLISVDFSINSLIMAGSGFGLGAIWGLYTGNIVAGGGVGLLLAALTMFVPIVKNAVWGLPNFIGQILSTSGASVLTTSTVVAIVSGLMALPWFWFLFSFVSQRQTGADT